MKFNTGDNRLIIDGPAGDIEAILSMPAELSPHQKGIIICHPHSLHGGSMGNKVVHTLAKTAVSLGMPALRFNFRSVGKSAGKYDAGKGEGDDLLSVWRWMESELNQFEFVLAGFSFGAYVSLKHAHRVSPAALISVAPPLKRFDFETLNNKPNYPWLIIAAEKDELIDLVDIETWASDIGVSENLVTIADASHFFHGKLRELTETSSNFLTKALGVGDD